VSLDEDEAWMEVDLQISCTSDAYIAFSGIANVIGVLIYPVGIPVGTMLLLWKHRQDFHDNGPAAERYDFLVQDYKVSCGV